MEGKKGIRIEGQREGEEYKDLMRETIIARVKVRNIEMRLLDRN